MDGINEGEGNDNKLFHQKCDGISKTICVFKSDLNKIFGGYTDVKWSSDNTSIGGNGNSFLFSLTYNTKLNNIDKNYEI